MTSEQYVEKLTALVIGAEMLGRFLAELPEVTTFKTPQDLYDTLATQQELFGAVVVQAAQNLLKESR